MFTAPRQSLRLSLPLAATLWCACGVSDAELGTEGAPSDDELSSTGGQALVSCAARTDTGYSNGNAFAITVVTADGQPIELATANAYSLMQRAAEAAGVPLRVVSGFRTMAEQRYLYSCYVNCNCNACTLAASPGYSNHQSGHALDLNTAAGGVYNWLAANAGRFGFARTVPSEPWHWEYWGGGPGGGACAPDALGPDLCTTDQRNACGNSGCGCFLGSCAGGSCPDSTTAQRYRVLTGDFDGDGKTDLATLSPSGGGGWAEWASVDLSTGSGFSSARWYAATPQHMRNGGSGSDYRVLTGDFNGDGKTDLATLMRNGGGGWAEWVALELSTGSSFVSTRWYAATPQHMRNGGSGNDYQVLTGDFNGDGKTDLATLTRNGGGGWSEWVALELSTGGGFVSARWYAATPQHMRNGGSGNDYRVLTGDFNGDGKTDLATVTRNGGGAWNSWLAMELSTGSGFTSTVWPAATPQHMRNGGSNADYRVLTGDFNGDGKTDVATLTRNGGGGWAEWVALELSTGGGFTSTRWYAATPQHMRNGGSGGDYQVLAEDFDGDGKTDLATVTKNGGGGWADWAALELSTGGSFVSTRWWTPTPQHMRNGGSGSDYRVLSGRFNADARADLVTVSPSGGGAWSTWDSVDLSTGSGFSESVWWTPTPQHMRNGGL
ncbi:MAG: FG-GAP repeat protein [Archangiaceae bacterium]|nr:FG-GAP repeat protein [Archangiaceae bacterium]